MGCCPCGNVNQCGGCPPGNPTASLFTTVTGAMDDGCANCTPTVDDSFNIISQFPSNPCHWNFGHTFPPGTLFCGSLAQILVSYNMFYDAIGGQWVFNVNLSQVGHPNEAVWEGTIPRASFDCVTGHTNTFTCPLISGSACRGTLTVTVTN